MTAEFDKLYINTLVNVPSRLDNLKTKVSESNVIKLNTVPIDLKKLGEVVSKEIVKNTKFKTLKTKVHNSKHKIPDVATLIQINQYNTDKHNLLKKNCRCW